MHLQQTILQFCLLVHMKITFIKLFLPVFVFLEMMKQNFINLKKRIDCKHTSSVMLITDDWVKLRKNKEKNQLKTTSML